MTEHLPLIHNLPLAPMPGVLMAEPILIAVIAAGGGSVAGLAALIVGVLNHRREKRTGTVAELRILIEELGKDAAEKGRTIDELCGKVSALERGRTEDHVRIRSLEDRVRDADELSYDYAVHVIVTDEWADRVLAVAPEGTPSPPDKSWRIRRHLANWPPDPEEKNL